MRASQFIPEGRVKELAQDLKDKSMSDADFEKKYGKTRAEARDAMRKPASESVAGPKNCWPGYRKVGTQPGTGKNAGKRVNDCEKIKEQGVAEGSEDNEPFNYDEWKASKVKPRRPRGYKDAEAIGRQQKEIDRERKEKKEQGVAEVSQQTLQSYRKKAAKQKSDALDVTDRPDTDDATWVKNINIASKRKDGIAAANKRLGVAENIYSGTDDTVGFSVNSEAAYQAVMARFGDHVDHDETSGIMYVPERMWPQVEVVAFDADGEGAVQADGLDEGEKIGDRHDADDFDDMVLRLKKLAGAGPMKTVYDPDRRVYRNMPTAQQPAQQPKK